MEKSEALKKNSIVLDAIDDTGKAVKARLTARIVEVNKQEVSEDDEGGSKAQEDNQFSSIGDVISPPHVLSNLALTYERSSDLQQLIRAMVTNVVGFGWRLVERTFPEGFKKLHAKEIEAEKLRLSSHLDFVHPTTSLTELRERSVTDKHVTGNGYLELIENLKGDLVGIDHIKSHLIGMTIKDSAPTKVMVPRVRPDRGFMIEEVPMLYRFRRFVQECGASQIWFKEAGDPRTLNAQTGEYLKEGDPPLPFNLKATSLIQSLIYTPVSSYGEPMWIGNTLSVLGDREAEEINYDTLQNNSIPAMLIIVENGALTDGSIDRLSEWTEMQIQGSQNRSKFLILEGETIEDGGPNPGNFRIKVEPLKKVQQQDELYQEYGKNNSDKIRQAFRLPPIFVGNAANYNRACYSEDTETLTENGWKHYKDIVEGEKIATFNPDTNRLEYHEPVGKVYEYDYDGHMYNFKNRNTDVLVTPDHKMWIKPLTNEAEYRKVAAEDIEFSRYKFMSSANTSDYKVSSDFYHIPEVALMGGPNRGIRPSIDIPIDLWVRFVSAFVADGTTTPKYVSGKERKMYNIQFAAHKDRKKDLFASIMSALSELGFRLYAPSFNKDSGRMEFVIADKGLWGILRSICGTKANNKKLPPEFIHYHPTILESILNTLRATDGTSDTRPGRTSWSYSTVSKELADQVQIIALHLGNRAHIISTPAEGNKQTCYRVLITPSKKEHLVYDSQVNVEWYTGRVYCYEVPNHLFFTRRNGRVTIQGNTADTSRDIADEQIFAPERNKEDYLINRFILPRWEAKYHYFKSNHPNITDDIELIRLMAIAERSGAMTPRRADNIVRDVFGDGIGPLPEGINVDKPFSISFAEAQKGSALMSGGDPGKSIIDNLVTMRKSLEEEIDREIYDVSEDE